GSPVSLLRATSSTSLPPATARVPIPRAMLPDPIIETFISASFEGANNGEIVLRLTWLHKRQLRSRTRLAPIVGWVAPGRAQTRKDSCLLARGSTLSVRRCASRSSQEIPPSRRTAEARPEQGRKGPVPVPGTGTRPFRQVSQPQALIRHSCMALLSITSETWTLVGFFAACFLLLIAPALVLAKIVVDACVGGDRYDAAVADVQRFLELAERSRRELESGSRLPLFDRERAFATSTSIGRALELKHAARRELWRPLAT